MMTAMNLGIALVIGAALIAAGIAVSHRYDLVAHACGSAGGDCTRAWLVDQWTGRMLLCEFASDSRGGNPACLAVRQ